MTKKALLLGVLLSSTTIASTSIAIKDNSDKQVTLSQNNINRLFIENDKVSDFKFPKGRMQVIGGKGAIEDDGSVYITDVSEKPFTLFVTSQNGHHFSLTVHGEEGLGKTLSLIPETPAIPAAKKWEQKNAYEKTLSNLMTSLIHGDVPDGYGVQMKTFSKPILWGKSIQLKPVKVFQGDRLMAEVFYVENRTKQNIFLKESFFTKGTLAVSLSSHELKPLSKVSLYVIRGVKNV
jgi:conjugal transfer pilus assembly protein TraK